MPPGAVIEYARVASTGELVGRGPSAFGGRQGPRRPATPPRSAPALACLVQALPGGLVAPRDFCVGLGDEPQHPVFLEHPAVVDLEGPPDQALRVPEAPALRLLASRGEDAAFAHPMSCRGGGCGRTGKGWLSVSLVERRFVCDAGAGLRCASARDRCGVLRGVAQARGDARRKIRGPTRVDFAATALTRPFPGKVSHPGHGEGAVGVSVMPQVSGFRFDSDAARVRRLSPLVGGRRSAEPLAKRADVLPETRELFATA